jgi:hypothetical protein
MFRPLQGHLQGSRKLHSLHIQCLCLLSHLVQFNCHIYHIYIKYLYLKYIKYTEYKILKTFVNFRSKMKQYGFFLTLCLPPLASYSVLALVLYIWTVSYVNMSCLCCVCPVLRCVLTFKGRNMCRGWRIKNIKWKYSAFCWCVIVNCKRMHGEDNIKNTCILSNHAGMRKTPAKNSYVFVRCPSVPLTINKIPMQRKHQDNGQGKTRYKSPGTRHRVE